MYRATFHRDWTKYFNLLENQLQERATKKIQKILDYPQKRHLRTGAKYFVGQVGQYRILYMVFEERQEVRFFFIGKHKEYEKWYRQSF